MYDATSYIRSMSASSVWQARLPSDDSDRYDKARAALGMSRSEALRHVLPYLEHEANHKRLAEEYDDFYGTANYPVENAMTE